MTKLTPTQAETLDFLKAYHKKYQFMPCLREIATAFDIKKPTAKFRLEMLSNAGYIKVSPKTARGIVILKG
ncbi:MAG: hypothetical protein GY861_03415 [bacterium]|nr:hypothetical protein [bacterium]